MKPGRADDVPGFRRRIRIDPSPGSVAARLEDDYHHMVVALDHDGERITAVAAQMVRAPWTTCPGAEAVLERTFTGALLGDGARRGLKAANCTHLFDLAVFASAHAMDAAPTVYDIAVSDPTEAAVIAELRRDGENLLHWELSGMELTAPAQIAGKSVLQLRDWIASLPPGQREAAKILQWACLLAHGRSLPIESQSDATTMPPNCYTFQPETAARAVRVGRIVDFSRGGRQPLEPGE